MASDSQALRLQSFRVRSECRASPPRLPLPQRRVEVGYDLAFEFALWGPGRLPSSQGNLEDFVLFCFFNSLVLFICFALIHKLGFLPLLFVPMAVISLQSGLGAWVVSGVDGTA